MSLRPDLRVSRDLLSGNDFAERTEAVFIDQREVEKGEQKHFEQAVGQLGALRAGQKLVCRRERLRIGDKRRQLRARHDDVSARRKRISLASESPHTNRHSQLAIHAVVSVKNRGVEDVFEMEIRVIGQKPMPVRLPALIPAHKAIVRLPRVSTRKDCDTADIAKTYRVCKTPAPRHSTRTHTVRIDQHLQMSS